MEISEEWEELPIKYGQESRQYQHLINQYSHGCPGVQGEDVCLTLSECASKGRCRVIFERMIL